MGFPEIGLTHGLISKLNTNEYSMDEFSRNRFDRENTNFWKNQIFIVIFSIQNNEKFLENPLLKINMSIIVLPNFKLKLNYYEH